MRARLFTLALAVETAAIAGCEASFPIELPGPRSTLTVAVTGPAAPVGVTSVPPGIECPPSCDASFDVGTSIVLAVAGTAATPVWSDAAECEDGSSCEIVLATDRTIDAGLFGRGDVIWSRVLSGVSAGDDSASHVAAGASGVVVTGAVRGGADLGGGEILPGNLRDPFVAKYALRDGAHLWSRLLVVSTFGGFGAGVALDENEDVVVAGDFQGQTLSVSGETYLQPHTGAPNTPNAFAVWFGGDGEFLRGLPSQGNVSQARDVAPSAAGFLVCADRNLDFAPVVWSSAGVFSPAFTGTARERCEAITAWGTTGRAFSGQYESANLLLGSNAVPAPAGSYDWIVASASSGFDVGWVRTLGGAGDDSALSLTPAGEDGSLLAAGHFTGTGAVVTLAPGITVDSETDFDGLLVSYTKDGDVAWWVALVGADIQRIASVTRGPDGDLWISGASSGPASFRSSVAGNTGVVVPTAAGLGDIFVARLSPAGEIRWARAYSGPGLDRALHLAVDAQGFAYVTGEFSLTLELDVPRTATSGRDGVVFRIAP